MIEVNDLRKRYGDNDAVAGLDLNVPRGEVFSFLGPNGAGKTTAVEILEGFRTRDGGAVRVLGQAPGTAAGRDWRARIGIVWQKETLVPKMPVRDVVRHFAGHHPLAHDPGELVEDLRRSRKEAAGLSEQAGAMAERERSVHGIHDTLAQGFTGSTTPKSTFWCSPPTTPTATSCAPWKPGPPAICSRSPRARSRPTRCVRPLAVRRCRAAGRRANHSPAYAGPPHRRKPPCPPREVEVLRLAADGHTNAAIGRSLRIGATMVKTHLMRTYEKLGGGERTSAVSQAIRRGLLPQD